MTTDLCLIPDAAQGDPGQLPIQRLGHRDGDGRLAHARRAYQAEDLPLPLRIHLPDGDGLQNPLFDLLQAVVVLFQHLAGGLHADALLGGLLPGHLQAHVQVVADHSTLGTAEGLFGQLVHLFEQVLFGILIQLQRHNFLTVGLYLIVIICLAQLVLQHPDLGAQDLLPLAADQLVPDLALQLVLKA